MSDNYKLTRARVISVNDDGSIMLAMIDGQHKGKAIRMPSGPEHLRSGQCLVVNLHPSGTAKWP